MELQDSDEEMEIQEQDLVSLEEAALKEDNAQIKANMFEG
jgi:hypothetical protein